MTNAGDGENIDSYNSLYYAYMLYLVAGVRQAQGQVPSFYPAVGAPAPDTGVAPPADQGTTPPPPGSDGSTSPPPPVSDVPMMTNESGVKVPVPREAGSAPLSGGSLQGGCALGLAPRPVAPPSFLALLLGFLFLARRRPRR
jgi:hypothetical protein